MTKRNDDAREIARSYIDGAVALQGGRRPSEEAYMRALASAEGAFRQLSAVKRESVRHDAVGRYTFQTDSLPANGANSKTRREDVTRSLSASSRAKLKSK
jgi:hypothetical protein